jgi:phosphoribosylformylglycinamidine (FGAM) synthase-like amidotransferase family enzyme
VRIAVLTLDEPPEGDVIVVPPGLGPALPEPVVRLLRICAEGEGLVVGIGDGVRHLCAAGLLPGAVVGGSVAPATHVRVEGRSTPFTWAIPAGRIVALDEPPPLRFHAPALDLEALAARGGVLLRYCDVSGGALAELGAAGVAGLCDPTGRVVGLLGGVTPPLDGPLGAQIRACFAR